MPRFEFELPDIGEGLAEVELVKWLVAIGDTVEENQPIADVESDKAVVTMPAPASGRVTQFCVQEGERLKVGAIMLVMETAGPAAAPSHRTEAVQAAAPSRPEVVGAPAPAGPVQASPAVRKRARELDLVLEAVAGSGPGGRITLEDVDRAAASSRSAASAGSPVARAEPAAAATPAARTQTREGPIELVPFRGIRRRIAEAMERSARTIPHVTGFHEFDAEALVRLHASVKPRADERGVRFTYLPFIVKAAAHALRAHPTINASLDEAAQVIQLKKFYNIGIAAATPDGLVVPVVQGVDRLSLLEIAREVERLTGTAREGRVRPDDLQHGTFTITNVGGARGWLNTSLIRAPEVAILGVGRVEERAVVRNGQIVARPIMPLALTFDHRVIDGEEGLGFMLTLRDWLEHPERLLLEGW